MSVLSTSPLVWAHVQRKRRSLLSMPRQVLAFMSLLGPTPSNRSALYKEIAIAGRCFADATIHGESALAAHWERILQDQHTLLLRWETRTSPRPRVGRPPGRCRETDEELDDALKKGFAALRKDGESIERITQTMLLRKMGRSREDPKRVREWRDRLGFDSWQAMKTHYFCQ